MIFFETTTDSYGNRFNNYVEKHKTLDYIISDALYRIYDEDAISSLNDNYIHFKKLILKQETDN